MGSIDFSKNLCEKEAADEAGGMDNVAFDNIIEESEKADEVRDSLRNDGNNNKGAGGNNQSRGQTPRSSLTSPVVRAPSQRRRSSIDRIRQTKPYRQLSRVLSTTFYHQPMNYALEGMTESVIMNSLFFPEH